MKLKIQLLTSFFLLVLFALFSAQTVSAASYQLSGRVTNSSGVAIYGSEVDVIDTATSTTTTSTTTDVSGNYLLSLNEGI